MSYLSPFAQLVKKLLPSVQQPSRLNDEVNLGTQGQLTDLQVVLAAIRERFPVILVHGRAGTGKSTLIQEIRNRALNAVVLAPTGLAAVNVGGQTIHSFFQFPPRIVDVDEIHPTNRLRSILSQVDLIIIDEISMVRADLIDAIDKSLRVNTGSDLPFGGKQILMAGDFLQLPPIVKEQEIEVLRNRGYETFYAFGAECLRNTRTKIIELLTVYRQTDPRFLEMLGHARLGQNLAQVVENLNNACYRPHRNKATPVLLTATNNSAEGYNQAGMAALRSPSRTYVGTIQNEFNRNALPAPERLELKMDARIMMVKNDPNGRWVNGSLGIIAKLSPERVWVCLDGETESHQVDQATWENVKYQPGHGVRPVVVGTYSQLPIRHAWAITVHKSQGLTLNDVRLDLNSGAFANGQTYVALSRARTLEGLSFAQPINIADILVDEMLVDGVQTMVATHTSE